GCGVDGHTLSISHLAGNIADLNDDAYQLLEKVREYALNLIASFYIIQGRGGGEIPFEFLLTKVCLIASTPCHAPSFEDAT
ncbi:hypothetical protein HMPREF1544_00267, partial [Mucor circinelloides 1006PhL]